MSSGAREYIDVPSGRGARGFMTCDGHGRFECFCAGDHCACGNDREPVCSGCPECKQDERSPLVFRVVADTNPRHDENLWRMEARRGREQWHLVSDGLTNEDVDKQVAYARRGGFEIDDQRSRTPGQLFPR